MRQENINGHEVLIEDDIAELSIKRFQKYNKFMLIESCIGSNLNDICQHIDKACVLMKRDTSLATTELQNLKQAMYFVSQELTPKYMAFACLVLRIDGQPISDISDENLKGIVKLFSGHKHRLLDKIIEAVKKKIEEGLIAYYPDRFDSSTEKQYYDYLKQITLLKCKKIQGEDVSKDIEELEIDIAMLLRPQSFMGKDNMEIKYDKDFEDTCLIISKELHVDPKKMRVLEYFNALDYLKRLQKERDKILKKSRNG